MKMKVWKNKKKQQKNPIAIGFLKYRKMEPMSFGLLILGKMKQTNGQI
jgi:hypothetical protein